MKLQLVVLCVLAAIVCANARSTHFLRGKGGKGPKNGSGSKPSLEELCAPEKRQLSADVSLDVDDLEKLCNAPPKCAKPLEKILDKKSLEELDSLEDLCPSKEEREAGDDADLEECVEMLCGPPPQKSGEAKVQQRGGKPEDKFIMAVEKFLGCIQEDPEDLDDDDWEGIASICFGGQPAKRGIDYEKCFKGFCPALIKAVESEIGQVDKREGGPGNGAPGPRRFLEMIKTAYLCGQKDGIFSVLEEFEKKEASEEGPDFPSDEECGAVYNEVMQIQKENGLDVISEESAEDSFEEYAGEILRGARQMKTNALLKALRALKRK